MVRRISIALAALAAVASLGASAHADPVTDAQRTVDAIAGTGVGHDVGGGGTGIDAPGTRSAVVGYVFIDYRTSVGQTRPTFTAYGALADPTLWNCSDNFPAVPYAVTCNPVTSLLTWRCDVLHADISGLSATARARTSLDCDGLAPPEAQTAVVGGIAHDFVWSPSSVLVTKFTCTIDGASLPASPDYYGGCGDPGLVTLEP